MKRALAERAKQSLPASQELPVPPSKLRRVASSPEAVGLSRFGQSDGSASDAAPVPAASTSSSTPQADVPAATASNSDVSSAVKRRPELSVPDDASIFYLKHQNRALAVEWRELNHRVQMLERERDDRRQQHCAAAQALQSLNVAWSQLEDMLLIKPTNLDAVDSGVHLVASSDEAGSTPPSEPGQPQPSTQIQDNTASSTGSGDSVEWTTALARALSQLRDSQEATTKSNDGCMDEPSAIYSSEWFHQCASNITKRTLTLQEHLTLFRMKSRQGSEDSYILGSSSDHRQQILELQSQIATLQAQVSEVAASRSDAVASERKLRRNFYKLQAGLLSKEQFLKEMNLDADEDLGAWAQEQALLLEQARSLQQNEMLDKNPMDRARSEEASSSFHGERSSILTSAEANSLTDQIKDWEEKVTNRDESIQKLSEQLSENERRITELSMKQLSEDQRLQLESFETTVQDLKSAQASVKSLELKLQETKQKLSVSIANEQIMREAMEEQQQKFSKKWEELSVAFLNEEQYVAEGLSCTQLSDDQPHALLQAYSENQARQIEELKHRLAQAIESVRQAEATRDDLQTALVLNESLQRKLKELNDQYAAAKNATVSNSDDVIITRNTESIDGASAAANSNKESGDSGTPTGPVSAEKFEKLHREHKRMRKDLIALAASKDAAKSKMERAEKERDSLLEMNSRLLKQMTEKDEMNAKSLSTILHLKGMAEQLSSERDNLERQAKSASQLALAARLATNAKERVAEEILKEKQALEAQLADFEEKLAASKRELDRVACEYSDVNGKVVNLNSELSGALKRSDELVGELEKRNAEIRDLIDLVKKAERRASDISQKSNGTWESHGGAFTSNFSVEQLSTQVSVLKSKLACPVCHYRDKECIIMRCRHLHCKQCVEERISSRNRKCPTCNNKFTEKDVADIWLNT